LTNSLGDRFMSNYAPDKMELAPRDLVSRSEQTEIDEGRGLGPDGQGIYLDLRHLGRDKILARLPQVRDLAIDFVGVDPIDDPIPIQPTAHYSMGGIPTDIDGQVIADEEGTPVAGFFAAGECACVSVHGANRLGTNSLLEASLFGRRAGVAMASWIKGGIELQTISGDPANQNSKMIAEIMGREGDESVERISQELKAVMTDKCGIFRDKERLESAQEKINILSERFARAAVMDKSQRFNTDLLATLETKHLLDFSKVIVAGAYARTESRGAHSRTDHPKRDDDHWLKHTLVTKSADQEPVLTYKAVDIDWDRYPPQERKY
jgi:succinate dehydrogenase / fumarate reductase flavoprotein subunit